MAHLLPPVTKNPSTIHLRVFIGNLNTRQLTKENVFSIFGQYGQLTGLSMHHGFAFIEYTTEYEARSAVAREDAKIYADQQIDVTMAAEPKHPTKKEGGPRGGPVDWLKSFRGANKPFTNTYNYQKGGGNYQSKSNLVSLAGESSYSAYQGPPAAKRPAPQPVAPPTASYALKRIIPKTQHTPIASLDVLICGNCKQTFDSIHQMTAHKRQGCALKFACKCSTISSGEPSVLRCAICRQVFSNSWLLICHSQASHDLNIYEVGGEENNTQNVQQVEPLMEETVMVEPVMVETVEKSPSPVTTEESAIVRAMEQDGNEETAEDVNTEDQEDILDDALLADDPVTAIN